MSTKIRPYLPKYPVNCIYHDEISFLQVHIYLQQVSELTKYDLDRTTLDLVPIYGI